MQERQWIIARRSELDALAERLTKELQGRCHVVGCGCLTVCRGMVRSRSGPVFRPRWAGQWCR